MRAPGNYGYFLT